MKKRISEEFVRELYRKYQSGFTLRELGMECNVSYNTIRAWFKRYRLPGLRPRSRNPRVYTSKLAEILTPEDAYWLGFLCGDGYIDEKQFSIYLKKSDREHLVKLKKYLGIEGEIKENKATGCLGFSFSSCLWHEQVAKHGLTYLKCNRFVPDLPSELMDWFWRGLFDADGSLLKYERCVTFTGPQVYVEGFRAWINLPGRGEGGKAGTYYRRKGTPNTFEVRYGGRDIAIKVLKKLYAHLGPKLERKYDRYKLYLKLS